MAATDPSMRDREEQAQEIPSIKPFGPQDVVLDALEQIRLRLDDKFAGRVFMGAPR